MKSILTLLTLALALAAPMVATAEAASENTIAEASAASPIMGEALDGSSVETFEEGLAKVQENATKEEYTLLRRSLGMLLAYDVGVSYSKTKLDVKLDGKTPTEIIEEAERYKR